MKCLLKALFIAQVLAWPLITLAYEIINHEKMSEIAAQKSALRTDTELLHNLGLKSPSESQNFPDSQGYWRGIIRLITRGANLEDGFYGTDDRPRNHFYDPSHDRGLNSSILGYPIRGERSPDWALEDRSDIDEQEFSFKDAREYLYKALTLLEKTERYRYFGRTFQTLGHVIHHLQDMAQPQHVRNDMHLDFEFTDPNLPIENPSLYEHYTKNIPIGQYAGSLDYNFNTARKFWISDPLGPIADYGKGISEFTNRNFVSAGTNFRSRGRQVIPHDDYPLAPQFDENTELVIDIKQLLPNTLLEGKLIFYGNQVHDRYTGSLDFNPLATTVSIFDADLSRYRCPPGTDPQLIDTCRLFTLNRFNFDSALAFLIPRAIGYSAGLIDYFFRGKLDWVPNPDTPGWVIKNLSQEPLEGTFTLYYDDAQDQRHAVPGGQWSSDGVLGAQAELPVARFNLPTDPPPKAPDSYLLVFNGTLGEEKPIRDGKGALAAKQVTLQPPGLTALRYASLLLDGTGRVWFWGGLAGQPYAWSVPQLVPGITNITALATGPTAVHILAISTEGQVWAWGNNHRGKLGDGTTLTRSTPVPVLGLSDAVAVAVGGDHSVALTRDGGVWTWGSNVSYALGYDTGGSPQRLTPTRVPGLPPMVAIAAGGLHTLALGGDGTVWAWGDNIAGQGGLHTQPDGSFRSALPEPVPVPGISGVVAIAAGDLHSLALTSDGTVWAWGYNRDGQLGNGDWDFQEGGCQASGEVRQDCSRPVPGPVLTLSSIVEIAAGENHNLARDAQGVVWAWGANYFGALGNGAALLPEECGFVGLTPPCGVNRPVRVGISQVARLAAGGAHNLTLQQDQTLWSWGFNAYGQLGNGTFLSEPPYGEVVPNPAF